MARFPRAPAAGSRGRRDKVVSRYSNAGPSIRTEIRRALNQQLETKHKSFVASSFTDIGSTVGTLTQLTNISQGVGDNERVGNRISVQKVYIQKVLRVEDNTSIPHATIRILVVQSRGGSLSTADMPQLMGPVDLDKMYVLKDKLVNLSSVAQNSTGTYFGSNMFRLKLNFKSFPKKSLQYDDANTTPANNPIYLYMFCDNLQGQQGGFETIYYKDG